MRLLLALAADPELKAAPPTLAVGLQSLVEPLSLAEPPSLEEPGRDESFVATLDARRRGRFTA